ncbi:hypothetical protein FS935_12575 [Metabacillus litoralis]|uniref:UPF0738 protein FS935_12575 n=1 Tax=Metabacillus litoralis TaxID=152268 RepID=A0A5C6W186_9BACI|nr:MULTISPECIES: hypothetical protein [Metabacillus]MBM7604063.1 hypothetical protein [Metabacillus crassostreae]TXC90739.1 hypothetical protein FS935_12575 [Metabacillus litoralis]
MNKRIELTKANINNKTLVLEPESTHSEFGELKAKGQMLVDSDHLAFIYILDSSDAFVYASLPHSIWSELRTAKEDNLPVIAKIGDQELELVELSDELTYLLGNIKDNANYGEEMENKVVEAFLLT